MIYRFGKALALSILLLPPVVEGQNPLITGDNPSVQLGNTRFNIGTMRVVAGSGAPGTVNAPNGTALGAGDFYIDTTNSVSYQCFAFPGPCTAVGALNWVRAASPNAISIAAFGVNGTSTDPTNLQAAITAAAGNFCLYFPQNINVNMSGGAHVSVPSNSCITGDGADLSKITASGLSTTGVGIFDIPTGSSNIYIERIGIDGGVTGPTGVLYSTATAAGPNGSIFTTGSTFWVHGPASNIKIRDLKISHTGGYAMYFDATTGNISNVNVTRIVDQNARPNLFGTSSGNLNYGSWTGGVHFHSPGSGSNLQSIVVEDSLFQNVTGNALWITSSGSSLMNSSIRFSGNTCIDVGLDCIQAQYVDNYLEYGNKATRFGYVVLSDIGSSRVGGPMWLQNFTPVAFDTYGKLTNFVRGPNQAEGNGEMFDCDGCANGSVHGNDFISCFASSDPLANSTQCGPSTAVGQNYTRGLTTNNSAGILPAPINITFQGNSFVGVGNGGFALFPCIQCVVSGNTIQMAGSFSNPIVLGNISTNPNGHSTGNLVANNTIFWVPTAGSPAVYEDGASICSCPFFSNDMNIVRSNNLVPSAGFGGLMYEFQKATPDTSGTGALHLSSVSTGANSQWEMVLQTEGTVAIPSLKIYDSPNGAGTLVGQFSLQGFLPLVVNFSGLPSVVSAGQVVYCTNCTPGSTPCSSGGTGHLATTNGSQWNCN